jgi:hypothetical protein
MNSYRKLITTVLYTALASSCSTLQTLKVDCEQMNDSNYHISQVIDRQSAYKVSEQEIMSLKKKLITNISSSVKNKVTTQGSIIDNVSKKYYGSETSSVSYGFLVNPNITYCRQGKDIIVVLSVNKRSFIAQAMSQYENELNVNLITINSALTQYDSSKKSFNKSQAKLFSTKVQEIESLHALVVNPDNYSSTAIQEYNTNIALLASMANEYSKRSYVFDDEKRALDILIKAEEYKPAYSEIITLIRAYGPNSNEGVDLTALLDAMSLKIDQKWKEKNRLFHEQLLNEDLDGAMRYLNSLNDLSIDDLYIDKYESNVREYNRVYKKLERNRILSLSIKDQEFYFGINATSSYGNIINNDNAISLNSEESNFNYDNILPSYKIGYRYFFKPLKRFGLFTNLRGHSFKSIEVNESDYEFPFSETFTELQAGVSFGVFDVAYGQFLKPSIINGQEINFKTVSVNLSLLTTDNQDKGKRNYVHLYTGLNLISDFNEVNYINISVGLNYHIRFNRKLNQTDKRYLRTL